ncbi:MAG: HEPN domain-containing protein [Thermodesulfobacteriota bacterium]
MDRYDDWLRQAQNDLDWADHSLAGGFFAQTCFIAQQAGEKSLKAYCFFKGFDIIRTHSLFQIVKSLAENGVLEQHARLLDLYSIAARYPDAFPAGAPFEIISRAQAEQALAAASEIHRRMADRIAGIGDPA